MPASRPTSPNAIARARAVGQSIWLDFISRDILRNGELRRLVDLGVSGVTSNPTIFEKSISTGSLYDADLLTLARHGSGTMEIYEALAFKDIADAADVLRPVYDAADGADGFVSIEVNPELARDTAATIAEARRISRALGRPNVLIKVPATPEGIPAIRALIGEGISVNVTLIFSLDAYRTVADAYIAGLNDRARSGAMDLSRIASVASFFVSRVDTLVDRHLEAVQGDRTARATALKGTIAIANAKLAYLEFKRLFDGGSFGPLRRLGARPQRTLWASTSTKNPSYHDTMYLDGLMGPNTVNTLPPATLEAFLDHGKVANVIGEGAGLAREQIDGLKGLGISYDAATAELLDAGVKAFADSFKSLLANIDRKRAGLLAAPAGR
jgi:transaldolase